MTSWWRTVNSNDLSESEQELAQGDLLRKCKVPIVDPGKVDASSTIESYIYELDLIVMTQSCDLVNDPANGRQPNEQVSLCPVDVISTLFQTPDSNNSRNKLETIRKGYKPELHLLASPESPADQWQTLYVDFRSPYSLSYDYLVKHAKATGSRPRLNSPYLEHFSQAFARFFMRVGLPSDMPSFVRQTSPRG